MTPTFEETDMRRVITLLAVILLAVPALAKGADPTPKAGSPVPPGGRKLPAREEALSPKVANPRNRDLRPTLQDVKKLPLPADSTGKSRVPLSGHLPLSDAARRAARPSRSPLSPELRGSEGVQRTLTHRLRLDGRTGRVDLRGLDRAVSRLDWQLDAPESVFAFLTVSRHPSGRCPSAGSSKAVASRELASDPSVVSFHWVPALGSNRTEFSGTLYRDLTDVYIQVCGASMLRIGDPSATVNGVASNVVHVQLGSLHQVLRVPVARWSIEWSLDRNSNLVCGPQAYPRGSAAAPTGTPVGFKSQVSTGPGPIPCVRDSLYVYQPSARFDLTGLTADARIVRAELRFTETDLERRSESGRLCTGATRRVGLATAPVGTRHRSVRAVSASADDARSLTSAVGGRRSLDVAGWLEAWLRGQEADVTFLGPSAQGGDNACLGQLADVHISVEYEEAPPRLSR